MRNTKFSSFQGLRNMNFRQKEYLPAEEIKHNKNTKQYAP